LSGGAVAYHTALNFHGLTDHYPKVYYARTRRTLPGDRMQQTVEGIPLSACFVDTAAWVAILSRKDPDHERSTTTGWINGRVYVGEGAQGPLTYDSHTSYFCVPPDFLGLLSCFVPFFLLRQPQWHLLTNFTSLLLKTIDPTPEGMSRPSMKTEHDT